MPRGLITSLFAVIAVSAATVCAAQVSKPSATASVAASAEKGASLAESGHCAEALPLLKKSIHLVGDKELQKRMGLDGVRCAMTSNAPYDALTFLEVLTPTFARDPEVLYAATHAFSDLSFRASQDLMHEAPFSYQVHEINAEALEVQGKWDEAGAEYRSIL